MIKTIHVCKNIRGSGKWIFTLYLTSRSYLKILSSNLCSVSYELDQESEQLDLSSYFLLIRSSGSHSQGTFCFSSYNVFQGLISHLITGVSTSSFLYTNTYAIHTFRVLSDNPIKSIGHRAFSIPDKPDEKVLM